MREQHVFGKRTEHASLQLIDAAKTFGFVGSDKNGYKRLMTNDTSNDTSIVLCPICHNITIKVRDKTYICYKCNKKITI